MSQDQSYLPERSDNPVADIVAAIDRDVARSEDWLMLGLATVILSSTFAPVLPPPILLPLVALTFAISASCARLNYHKMQRKLASAMQSLNGQDKVMLRPIAAVFTANPMPSLADSFNPLKNIKRTWKSVLGGLLINPFWMPIFYVMGMQIGEEKNLIPLNAAIISVEQKLAALTPIIES
jgi:hypothetical protein